MFSARTLFAALLCVLAAACAEVAEEAPYVEHETPADFELVAKAAFDRERVLDDALLLAADAVSAAEVQRFLERTPYGTASFLARERVGGRSAAEAIVAGARAEGINPIVMLARMQAEKSLIAKTQRPSAKAIDYAFGCGCPDGRACNAAFRGLDRQIACAARTLRTHYDASVAGTGAWARGRAGRTLDGYSVTPKTHATASLYAYTPWVLPNRGGNWLVWNVTHRFVAHFEAQGIDPLDGAEPDPGGGPADGRSSPAVPMWIGDACETHADCDFGGGQRGACVRFGAHGVCTVSCEGFCPDRAGRGTTFCVDARWFGIADGGVCTRKAAQENGFCGRMPGTVRQSAERHRGGSGAPAASADVCVPAVPD